MTAQTGRRQRGRGIEFGSLAAIPLAIGLVIAGQTLEGGSVRSLLQGAAALIVFGGTLGATLVSYSPADVFAGILAAGRAFRVRADTTSGLTANLLALSIRAHRNGIMVLENELETIADPFMRHGLSLAVDGVSPEALRETMHAEMRAREADDETPARIFETAGGYAPTFGILGAVLGLIHVMEQLNTPAALGSGIAVAFVSTVYGIGSANLLFFPIAGRLRERAAAESHRRALILDALVAMQQRTNPRLVADKMRAFTPKMPEMQEIASRVASLRWQPTRLPS